MEIPEKTAMLVNRERLWEHAKVLCEEIGPRLSGTPADERAVEYISKHFRRCGTVVEVQPELYRDLVVRVSGFSAYFVDLDKVTQDEIITRTEHFSI